MLYQDESTVRSHPYLSRMWAKPGADLRLTTPGKASRRHIFGVHREGSAQIHAITRATKNSSDFVALLRYLDVHFGPTTNPRWRPVYLVLDNGNIHTSAQSLAALQARPWLKVEWLPLYASELNPIERDWKHLKQHHLANRMFHSPQEMMKAIHQAIRDLNRSRCLKIAS